MQRVRINLHSCIEISQSDFFDTEGIVLRNEGRLEPRGILITGFIFCPFYFIIFYFIFQFVL